MHPMSFGEFLDAVGKKQLRLFIEDKADFHSIPTSFHIELIDFLKIYYFVGGMPEAVGQYVEDKNLNKVRNIQDEILSAYTIDFSKYTTRTEAIRLSNIWTSIPGQLARENKRFTFGQINKNARARSIMNQFSGWLKQGLSRK